MIYDQNSIYKVRFCENSILISGFDFAEKIKLSFFFIFYLFFVCFFPKKWTDGANQITNKKAKLRFEPFCKKAGTSTCYKKHKKKFKPLL